MGFGAKSLLDYISHEALRNRAQPHLIRSNLNSGFRLLGFLQWIKVSRLLFLLCRPTGNNATLMLCPSFHVRSRHWPPVAIGPCSLTVRHTLEVHRPEGGERVWGRAGGDQIGHLPCSPARPSCAFCIWPAVPSPLPPPCRNNGVRAELKSTCKSSREIPKPRQNNMSAVLRGFPEPAGTFWHKGEGRRWN